jgi:hypothetical protein
MRPCKCIPHDIYDLLNLLRWLLSFLYHWQYLTMSTTTGIWHKNRYCLFFDNTSVHSSDPKTGIVYPSITHRFIPLIQTRYCLSSCGMHLHGRIISLRGEVWSHKNSTPPLFIEVPVPSQESERSCIYVIEISILPLSPILIFDFGIVLTAWCSLFFIFLRSIVYWRSYDVLYVLSMGNVLCLLVQAIAVVYCLIKNIYRLFLVFLIHLKPEKNT